MKYFFLIVVLISFSSKVSATIKNTIIQNLKNTKNLSFNFEQNINGKLENGSCTIEYPKKINCKYDLKNKKVLVSNGRSLVIKTNNSYYIYPLEKTPLNLILDKNFLIDKVKVLEGKIIDENLINFKFVEENTEINVFFDKKTANLIGWQTIDIYQNLSITFIYSIAKNRMLKKNLFKLPIQN
jgi:outer membrane lipoprotein-sorting protein